MVTASLSDLLKKAGTTTGVVLAMSAGTVGPSGAEKFAPLCDQTHVGSTIRSCWNPVEVADCEGCRFFGHVSYFDHAPTIRWRGVCWSGMAMGHGVLFDDWGNRAEGRLVGGLKEGTWTVDLRSGGVITESHIKGVFHGPWTFDLPKGRFYALNYVDGRLNGPWEHRYAGHYVPGNIVADQLPGGALECKIPAHLTVVPGTPDGDSCRI